MTTPHQKYTYDFHIDGMTCASCVGRVERILNKIDAVTLANVNLATSRATIETSAPVLPEEISTKLKKAGFPSIYLPKTETIQYLLKVNDMTCASCTGRVERMLNKIDGISDIHVNLATGTAAFIGHKEIDIALILNKLAKAGYSSTILNKQSESSQATTLIEDTTEQAQQLFKQFIVALIFTLPVFLLEMGSHLLPQLHHWITHNIGQLNNWYIQFTFTTLVLLIAGRNFYIKGIPALLKGAPDMNSLVAVGTLSAYCYSVISTFIPQLIPSYTHAVYYESAAVIITLILLGRYLEATAKGKTSEAIQHLLNLQPKTAIIKTADGPVEINTKELQRNDIVIIKPGSSIPCDGIIIEGSSYVDESMMTGESLPVTKNIDDAVIGGTINQNGSLIIRVTATDQQSTLAKIIHLVEQAQGTKIPIQNLVNKITLWFVPFILLLAALTFVAWYFFADQSSLNIALINAVAVLIIACPCAMGLATPVSIMVATGRAAELGVLFKNAETLQTLKDIQAIAFDKTGTLTVGKPKLTDFVCAADEPNTNHILQLAISLESLSEHPIATALLNEAKAKNIDLLTIENFEAHIGLGVKGTYQNQTLYIGASRFIKDHLGFSIDEFELITQELVAQGKTPLYFAMENKVKALFAVADHVKPESLEAVKHLKQSGIEVVMISGDNKTTAKYIADQLAINHVIADVLPHQKVQALEDLKEKFGKVAFVGDGINDAPALAHADVGIAIGSGTDIAIESADIILMSGNVTGVVTAYNVSKMTIANIKQNLFWAFAYNLALIPVAMGMFYPLFGVLMSPMFAAAAMALSSVFVITNALRLRYIKV